MEHHTSADTAKDICESPSYMDFPIVIVGGGISGVSCLQQLALSAPERDVILITASSLVTMTTNVKVLTKTLTQFDVEERKMEWLKTIHPRVEVVHGRVVSFDPNASRVDLSSGGAVFYSRLCICTGATPKGLPGTPGAEDSPYVIGVRDAATAAELRRRVANSRRVVVTGNGGIASEVAYGLFGVQVIWVIRDSHINAAFIDPGAAAYLEGNLRERKNTEDQSDGHSPESTMQGQEENGKPGQPAWKIIRSNVTKEDAEDIFGSALGPDWQKDFPLHGVAPKGCESLHIEYSCEIVRVLTPKEVQRESIELFEWKDADGRSPAMGSNEEGTGKHPTPWPVYVLLTNGHCIGCDLIVAGTGVIPNSSPFLGVCGGPKSSPSDGNGLMVDLRLRTSTDRVFAAGDVVTAAWPNRSRHWLQMRLWTQARTMGFHVGRCIALSIQRELQAIAKGLPTVARDCTESSSLLDSNTANPGVTTESSKIIQMPILNVCWKEDDYDVELEDDESLYDFCFELFSHVTKFFGCRTILLGLFNGQGLGKEYEVVVRVGGGEYVKVIVGRDGKMAGAVLIGETDLEETFENLILSGLDVSSYGEDLLHPGVDLEDYFD